ncbi:MAG: aldo/keto reductase, partial [Acetatifactor sp.]|nr:aldo/keto reductase [Acetatifactor sp.]
MNQEKGYESMKYNRTGASGLLLPAMSFGLWHNFGENHPYKTAKEMVLTAFEAGITHFDLANNYGPPAGSAESTMGRILRQELAAHRDELILSTKAGYGMWPGPYGDGGSRKYLMSSLDQSLKRLGVDYVDIFYHHRPDPATPLEETMGALADIVRQGKALYIGLSNYGPKELEQAAEILESLGGRCLIHQHRYSMLDRKNKCLLPVVKQKKMGTIAFCPLEQGLLTDKYLHGIPKDSRAAGNSVFLGSGNITAEYLDTAGKLNELALQRGQSLAQMALAYALKDGELTSVILGAS